MQCLKLTTKSWLLGFGNENPSLLFETNRGFLYLSLKQRIEFSTLDEVITKFGDLIVNDLQPEKLAVSDIDSFPIKHIDAVVTSIDPPRYTRGGSVVFAAGYWGLKYSNGWTLTFCPKQNTLISYDTIGPFRNRLEALNQINSLNHQTHIGRKVN